MSLVVSVIRTRIPASSAMSTRIPPNLTFLTNHTHLTYSLIHFTPSLLHNAAEKHTQHPSPYLSPLSHTYHPFHTHLLPFTYQPFAHSHSFNAHFPTFSIFTSLPLQYTTQYPSRTHFPTIFVPHPPVVTRPSPPRLRVPANYVKSVLH